MRSLKIFSIALPLVLAVAACTADVAPTGLTKVGNMVLASGFDEFGYNEIAGIFNGAADGVDRVLDGKVWGDPTYAADHLVMKWNHTWENCNANRSPENCAGAWTNNEWNGQVEGGSGETWIYKIVWNGACGTDGTPLPSGGYCIWGEYAVLMSQGTVDGQHFWDAHASPNGLGLLQN